MTQSGLICKVLMLAFCGLFLTGIETAGGSGVASQISTEADSNSDTQKVTKPAVLPRPIHPQEVLSGPDRILAQIEKPGSPPKATGISESVPRIVPLELPPPAVSQTRPGLSPRGYTSRYFHIERPKVGLGLSYVYEQERTKSNGSETKDTSGKTTTRGRT